MRVVCTLGLVFLVLLPVGGCSRKVGGFKNKQQELEYRIDELEAANRRLDAERGELAAKVGELTFALDAATGTSSGAVVAALPRCAGITFDRLTALVDRDDQLGIEGVDAYIRPVDGRRRFVQVAGTMRVQLLLHSPVSGTSEVSGSTSESVPPRVLAEVTLDPYGLREAFRSGLTGTHYAVRLGLTPALGGSGEPEGILELVAQFDDAVTGLRHLATKRLDFGP